MAQHDLTMWQAILKRLDEPDTQKTLGLDVVEQIKRVAEERVAAELWEKMAGDKPPEPCSFTVTYTSKTIMPSSVINIDGA